MTANICTRLLNKVWRLYEVDDIPHIEGIYVIGVIHPCDDTKVLYVGRSKDIHRRMLEHRRQRLAIDKFVRDQFEHNGGEDLRVKWIKEKMKRQPKESTLNASPGNWATGQNTISVEHC